MRELNVTNIDDRQLDQLVDGELSAEESRRLLVALESDPDGWRRCAMAFLESQAWGRELGVVREESAPTVRDARAVSSETSGKPVASAKLAGPVSVAGSRPRIGGLWLPVAMAASFALTFAIGTRVERWRIETGPRSERAAVTSSTAGVSADEPPDDGGEAMNRLTLAFDGPDGTERRVEVPVYEPGKFPGAAESALDAESADLLARELLRMGHSVRRQRGLVPKQSPDGRHVVFPVDDYRIVPVGETPYQ